MQLGLNIPITTRGFFTLVEELIDCSLSQMEELLGYSRGRLKQGADIVILQPPLHPYDFDRMATSVFQGHRLSGSNLFHAINGEDKKMEDLRMFQRKRIVKVIPLMIHLEAMRTFLSEAEYDVLKETNTKGQSIREITGQWQVAFRDSPLAYGRMLQIFNNTDKLFRQRVNDALYPMALGSGVRQWELKTEVAGRVVCRMTDYSVDRYQRLF